MSHSIHIAYGSESGNSKTLALQLQDKLLAYQPVLCTLNDLVITKLTSQDVLLIISSSFGDGEPPGNASKFFDTIYDYKGQLDCQFAIFGLGDVSYPKFCGFTIDVDKKLQALKATSICKRVDADTSYQAFFEQWSKALVSYFNGDDNLLKQLDLQVKAYNEQQSFIGSIDHVQRINQSDFPVYDIQINISGSGMHYQAGDLLYLIPPANKNSIARINQFYPNLNDTQQQLLGKKELRQLSKPLIRAVAKHTKNKALKALTKMSAAKKLADYSYGRDVADLLTDYCTPENMPVDTLLDILPTQLPRAYSIASCGTLSPNSIRLCVREVRYQLAGHDYFGSGSYFLCHALDNSQSKVDVKIYVRANAHFHLPKKASTPIIMIGAGTGIAPYLGFLAQKRSGETHLFFGERYHDKDFLYQTELEEYVKDGRLTALYTAFSRDQAEKIYVQDILRQQGKKVWQLLENNAEIYVCGSKTNLSKPIDNALMLIAKNHGGLEEEEATRFVSDLLKEQRYHQDLY
ncbi:MAG: sulfite reductase [Gammaproteobacteria bacterium]|nr:MAG: sulfite reductase [Gammaproteobacteria bacterium]